MSWQKEADRELNRAFEFVVWGFQKLFEGLAWLWDQTPANWPGWGRVLLLLALVMIAPRLIRMVLSLVWRSIRGAPAVYGQARFASMFELHRAGLFKPGGRFLGQTRGRDLYLHGEGHCLTIAAQGSGKTTGLIIPTLITYRAGSVIVTDPKGAITAQTRRLRGEAGRVVVLNPWQEELAQDPAFALDLGDDGFNPLQLVGPDYDGRSAATTLAGLLLPDLPGNQNPFWRQEARELLEWGMLYQAAKQPADKRTLPRLRALLYDPATLMPILKDLAGEKPCEGLEGDLRATAMKYYAMAQMGAGQQLSGILATTTGALKIYAGETRLARHVSKPDGFCLADLKGDVPLTVYLICPPSHLVGDDRAWLNLVLALMTQQIGKPGRARETVMLMDEFPALGYLPNLLPSLEQFREAGLRAHLIAQNPGQVLQVYGQDGLRRLMGIAEYKQFFRITDPEQARQLSEWLGHRTEQTQSRNQQGQTSTGQAGVPLIRPEELSSMPRGQQIIMRPEGRPVKGRVIPFYKRKEWAKLVDANPYRD